MGEEEPKVFGSVTEYLVYRVFGNKGVRAFHAISGPRPTNLVGWIGVVARIIAYSFALFTVYELCGPLGKSVLVGSIFGLGVVMFALDFMVHWLPEYDDD